MHCPYCGNEIPVHASICTFCGSNINLPAELSESEIRRLRRKYRESSGISSRMDMRQKLSQELSYEIIPAMYLSRAVAFLIDWIIIIGVAWLFLFSYSHEEISEFIFLLIPLWAFLYFMILMWVLNGRTIGKLIVSIQIIKEDSSQFDIIDSIKRTIYSIVSFLFMGMGFIAPFFDSKSRAWHDHLTGTIVIYTR